MGRAASVRGAALYSAVVVFMHGPLIFQHPDSFATWSGAAEQVTLVAGGLAAYACLMQRAPVPATPASSGLSLGKAAEEAGVAGTGARCMRQA